MVALPAVPKVVRFDIHQTMLEDLNVMNRVFLQYSGALSTTDLNTVTNTLSAAWTSHVFAHLSTALKMTAIEATDLSSTTAPRIQNTFSGAGTNAAAPLSNGAAFVIGFGIARRYRGGKPRIYLAGLPSGMIGSDGRWIPSFLSSVLGDFQAFTAAAVLAPPAAVGTLAHVNVSYYQGFTPVRENSGRYRNVPNLRTAPVVDAVQTYIANPFPASQRRRNETP